MMPGPIQRAVEEQVAFTSGAMHGGAIERADVLALLASHRAVLVRKAGLAEASMEVRRIDELIATIAGGLHAGLSEA